MVHLPYQMEIIDFFISLLNKIEVRHEVSKRRTTQNVFAWRGEEFNLKHAEVQDQQSRKKATTRVGVRVGRVNIK